MKTSTPRYEHLLFTDLGIDKNYLNNPEHQKVIRTRFLNAAAAMRRRLGEIVGINACIHVASSIVLMSSDPDKLAQMLKDIPKGFPGIDPTIVLTAATLYYLLVDLIVQEAKDGLRKKQKKDLEHVFKRFQDMRWMIGETAMNKLEIVRRDWGQ